MDRNEAIETIRANYPSKCFSALCEACDVVFDLLENKVIPLDQVKAGDVVWIETRCADGTEVQISQRTELNMPIYPFDVAFKQLGMKGSRCYDADDYEITWRCWKLQPTGKDMEKPWKK